MRILGCFFAFLILSGCAGSVIGDGIAGPEKLAQQDDAYCRSIGLKFGTSDYASCRMQTTQRREDKHSQDVNESLATLGAALTDYSQK